MNIYTKKPYNYFSKEFIKEVGRFVFRKKRGPQAVVDSLIRGLSELGEIFSLNNKNPKLDGSEVFFINSSIDSLRWAIKLKKEKKIKKLIAGPNLVVMPNDYNHVISSQEIDLIILPSDWVKRAWVVSGFNSIGKIRIWPAGTFDDGIKEMEKIKVLVYKKNISDDVCLMVDNVLESIDIAFEEILYGNFSRNDYFSKLDKAICLVYLQRSESQGLSLLEAWMKNVPTFVYSKGNFEYNGMKIDGDDISAPYLNNSCGAFFKTKENLEILIKDLLSEKTKYHPRDYYLNQFTDKICAKKLIDLINE